MNNSCTGCTAATGNTYFVDPINGDDGTATGSGIAAGVATPSCSFKTVTHALVGGQHRRRGWNEDRHRR